MPINPNPQDASQTINYDYGLPITNTFEFVPGVCVLPLAEEPPTSDAALAAWSPVVTLQLHAPYRVRRTNYEAHKSSNPPVMPSPQSTGAFVFVGGSMSVRNTLNPSYVAFDWEVGTNFVYVEDCVSRPQDGLVLGTPPWTWNTSAINETINAAVAVLGGVIAAGSVVGGAVAQAGYEVRVSAAMGNTVNLDGTAQYLYNMPSFFPGTFFNDYLVNGGVPPQGG